MCSMLLSPLAAALLICFSGVPVLHAQSSVVPVTPDEAEQWRQDLRVMAEEMPRLHKNLFHSMMREQFQNAVEGLRNRIPTLARHQVIVAMARIAAMADDGHTNISPTRDPKIGFRTYPLKLYLFRDGLFVRAATRTHGDIVGWRVVQIGNAPAAQAYAAVREIVGRDNEMDAKFFAPFLLTMPEVLHALNLIDDMGRAEFTLERGGTQKRVALAPWGPAELLAPDTDTSWNARPGWIDARDSTASPTPLWLRNPGNKFWFEYMEDAKTMYVQYNHVANKDSETVEAFAQRLFSIVDQRPVARFILDLRLNRGGNGALNRPLLLGIIRSRTIDQKGKLFTIIGRSTWSAAQFLVNQLELYTNTVFVGEPSGGKVNSYGDSRKFTLPNSGITVRVSSLWWQGDERDRRPWTAPRIAAELTSDQYRANVDPALEAIFSYNPLNDLTALLREALAAGDTARLAKTLRAFREDPTNAYVDCEETINTLGYELLGAGDSGGAIDILRLNVSAFPRSSNAYDSLGEACLAAGQTARAVEYYRISLDLDPGNDNARQALRRLGAK